MIESPHKNQSLLTKVAFWASGAHQETLKNCDTERNFYQGNGVLVIFTGLFATLTSHYAATYLVESSVLAWAFGICWGTFILFFDRFILTTMDRIGTKVKTFSLAVLRLFFALSIAFVISKPLVLRIFQPEINEHINNETLKETDAFKQSIDAKTKAILLPLQTVANTINSNTVTKKNRIQELKDKRLAEINGTSGSRKYGDGVASQAIADEIKIEEKLLE